MIVRAKFDLKASIHKPVRKSLMVLIKSLRSLLLFSKYSFFFWAFSRAFIVRFFTSWVWEAMSWSWAQGIKQSNTPACVLTVGRMVTESFTTFLVTPCSSFMAAFRLSVRFVASFSAVKEELFVPSHPSPPQTKLPWLSWQPHRLSEQLPFWLSLLAPPHTLKEKWDLKEVRLQK